MGGAVRVVDVHENVSFKRISNHLEHDAVMFSIDCCSRWEQVG
jgi:hypothetical protein